MLATSIELVRDLAVTIAAAGVAWWCWDQYRTSAERRDDTARLSLTAERQAADLRQWAAKLDEGTTAIAAHLAHLAQSVELAGTRPIGAGHDNQTTAARLRVHRLLHGTTDPFLTFVEIERALGGLGRLAELDAAGEHDAIGHDPPLAGDRLRQVLIGLVSDGVVAQLDRDRYFIASDYETGNGDGAETAGDVNDAA